MARTKALKPKALVRTIADGEKPFARLLNAERPVATLPTIPAILTFCPCGLCDAWAWEQGCVLMRLKSR